jgi:hypothetical protein
VTGIRRRCAGDDCCDATVLKQGRELAIEHFADRGDA